MARYALLVVVALLAAACGTLGDDGRKAASSAIELPGDEVCSAGSALHAGEEPIPGDTTDPAATFPWEQDEPRVADGFEPAEVVRVLQPDTIPALDAPCFEPVTSGGEWLEPRSPLLALDLDGDGRAYPLAILTFHEIVNDVVGGQPVAVTYCPLCNSGLAFHRGLDDRVLDFGTSGRLYRSNLLMYDRQERDLWLQFTGEAVSGDAWTGAELERIPTAIVSWEEFREGFPGGWVLTRETGIERDYWRNPYPGYEDGGVELRFEGPTDDRLPADARVVGLAGEDGEDATAVPLDVLRQEPVAHLEIADEPLVVLWAPGAASAVDRARVNAGRDVGQTGVFRPRSPDGEALTFRALPDEERWFVDSETGSTWTVLGEAVAGPLEGARLEPVARDDTWWFVWSAFQPETAIHRP